ncbi:MAG: DUF86 domain-containing protein [Nanoarchaeota archaeon]|nr:DUF86 domain-containing protein [Nanoarchaeota archaeon]MBU0977914.1 DUF86 domain-containing protein [Nanoarchaeota archaeon]
MKRDILLFIEDISEAIKKIETFSMGVDETLFLKDELRQSAIIRQLEVIGEAVKNIPEEFRAKYPLIEWKKIAGFRDVLIHAYFGADPSRIWRVIEKDLPKLKENIQGILKKEKKK